MKYTVKQYAVTLLDVLTGKETKNQAEIIRRFMSVLQKNGDFTRRVEIAREAERQYFKKHEIHKVDVELASETPSGLEREISEALGKKIVFSAHLNKNILGGIKILIDDDVLIDGSAKTQINKLFSKV